MLSSLAGKFPPAILALADGSVFIGQSIGAAGTTVGEVVFNTAMTGYQEILTDPSYRQQIVTLTYPHIGNYGVNDEDVESDRIQAAGLIVKDLPLRVSNFRSQRSLDDYLKAAGTVALAGIDTRKLTRVLRTSGAQNGAIVALADGEAVTPARIEQALAAARGAPSRVGLVLAKVVSTGKAYDWTLTEWALGSGFGTQSAPRFHVVAYDFGVKKNILRMLAARGCRVTVVPAQTPAAEVLAQRGCKVTVVPAQTPAAEALKHQPDGVFLSNGPGDPEPCDYAIAAARELIDSGTPVFGICLGHQIMALAAGAKTFKMKFGHHGANHPVQNLESGRVSITSQNHGFAVDAATLPENVQATHVSLFDGTLQGMSYADRPAYCFQGHPEALPGPRDIAYLFDRFSADMLARQEKTA